MRPAILNVSTRRNPVQCLFTHVARKISREFIIKRKCIETGLELIALFFVEGRESCEEPGEGPLSKDENQQQINQLMTLGPGTPASYIRKRRTFSPPLLATDTAPPLISNGDRTEGSPIRSVIIQVITKSDDRAAGVRFVYHKYDYRLNWTTRSLITS